MNMSFMIRLHGLFLLACPALSAYHWNATIEDDIFYHVLSELHIGRCILLTNDLTSFETVNRIKFLTERNIMSVAMNVDGLLQHFMYNKGGFSDHREIIVGGLHLVAASSVLTEINQVYLPQQTMRMTWLVFPTGSLKALSTLRVPYNCQFIICYKKNDKVEEFDMFEFYRLIDDENKFEYFGTWTQQTGLQVNSVWFYKRRYDFEGSQVTMLRQKEVDFESETERANVELWLLMGEMMNFTTRMVTEVNLQAEPHLLVDVGSESLAFHSTMLNMVANGHQIIAPILRKRMFMYIRHEIDELSRWAAYIRPLSPMVWLSLAFVVISASACLIVIGQQVSAKLSTTVCLQNAFIPLDSICNQGGEYIGQRISKRIAVICLRLLAVCVSHAYAGVIISTLTLQYAVFPFTDLTEFVQFAQYQMGAVAGTFGVGYFQYSQDAIAKRIATEFFESTSELPLDSLEGLRRCCISKYTFIADEDVLHYIDEKKISCKILRIPKPAFVSYTGMRLSGTSEYRPVFFYNLLYFYSSGILKRIGKISQMAVRETHDYEQVGLAQVYSLLTIHVAGVIISVLAIFLEISIFKYLEHGSGLN